MQKIDGTFQADGETLAYSFYLPMGMQKANVLSLHGAGPAARDRIDYFARYLLSLGFGTFCFDFSGHGESTGKLKESSLLRRTKQARAALQFIDATIPTVLVGTSMGGHISVEMLNVMNVSHLILFCPALYGDEAFDQPFDERFSQAIRIPNAFEHSSLKNTLKKFSGKSIVFIGDQDKIIPPRVIEIYREGLGHSGQFELVTLEGSPHMIHRWVFESEANMRSVITPIEKFIRN